MPAIELLEVYEVLEMAHKDYVMYICLFYWYNGRDFTSFSNIWN